MLELRIFRGDDLVRPAEEQVPVLLRDPEHQRDDCDGDRRGDIGDEVDLSLLARLVEDVARDGLDLRLPHRHREWREPPRGEIPVATVLRWIHREQVSRRRLLGLVSGEDGDPRLDEPVARVLADRDDVGVLGHRPEGVAIVVLDEAHGIVGAQPGPLRVWVALALVLLGRDDVEGGRIEVYREGSRAHAEPPCCEGPRPRMLPLPRPGDGIRRGVRARAQRPERLNDVAW